MTDIVRLNDKPNESYMIESYEGDGEYIIYNDTTPHTNVYSNQITFDDETRRKEYETDGIVFTKYEQELIKKGLNELVNTGYFIPDVLLNKLNRKE